MPFDAGFQSESVADLIERARAMIASRSAWCQSKLMDELGRHCAVGALTAVVFGDGDYNHIAINAARCLQLERWQTMIGPYDRRQIETFLRAACYLDSAAVRHGYENIMRLNDHHRRFFPNRQHKVVLDAMRDAAAWARKEEVEVTA
jgi:hypothetical protein